MNYTILIADDEPGEYERFSGCIWKMKIIRLSRQKTGRQALELLKKEHVDLCLLDIMMPEMDGIEMCRQIRKFSNIPVIFLSAKSADLDKILGLGCGADDYVTKAVLAH